MGSFFVADCVTGSTIRDGDPIVALYLQPCSLEGSYDILMESTSVFVPVSLPVYGTYADVGQITPTDPTSLGVQHLLGLTQQPDWSTFEDRLHAREPMALYSAAAPSGPLLRAYMHQSTWQTLLSGATPEARALDIDAVVALCLAAAKVIVASEDPTRTSDIPALEHRHAMDCLLLELRRSRRYPNVVPPLAQVFAYTDSRATTLSQEGQFWQSGPHGPLGPDHAEAMLADQGTALRALLEELFDQYTVLNTLYTMGRALVPSLYGGHTGNATTHLSLALPLLTQVVTTTLADTADDDEPDLDPLLRFQSELHGLVGALDRQIAHLKQRFQH